MIKGTCWDSLRTGPGNHQIVGYQGLKDILQVAVSQALHLAGLKIEQIAGAGFGIGGFDWPSQLNDHLDAIAPLGLDCPVDVVNNSIIALMAGTCSRMGSRVDCWHRQQLSRP